MSADWVDLDRDEAGLWLRHPSEWHVLRKIRGTLLVLLAPPGSSDFRSSMVLTAEEASGKPLQSAAASAVREMDRFLTGYRSTAMHDVEVGSQRGLRVTGTYRQGRVEVAMDQWLIDCGTRLLSVTVSYDQERDADFGAAAAKVVETLQIENAPPG